MPRSWFRTPTLSQYMTFVWINGCKISRLNHRCKPWSKILIKITVSLCSQRTMSSIILAKMNSITVSTIKIRWVDTSIRSLICKPKKMILMHTTLARSRRSRNLFQFKKSKVYIKLTCILKNMIIALRFYLLVLKNYRLTKKFILNVRILILNNLFFSLRSSCRLSKRRQWLRWIWFWLGHLQFWDINFEVYQILSIWRRSLKVGRQGSCLRYH